MSPSVTAKAYTCVGDPTFSFLFVYFLSSCLPATLTLRRVQRELKDVTDWYSLGVQLDVPTSEMQRLDSTHRGNLERCKLDTLQYWMRNSENVSWHYLAEALETMGGYANVMLSLRKREPSLQLSERTQSDDGMYVCFMCTNTLQCVNVTCILFP